MFSYWKQSSKRESECEFYRYMDAHYTAYYAIEIYGLPVLQCLACFSQFEMLCYSQHTCNKVLCTAGGP